MNRDAVLPLEFFELNGKVQYVVKRGVNEYSSSCPFCGGSPHPDGTYPDRFRMLIKSRATGKPMGWCRTCGKTFIPGKHRDWQPTPEQHQAWVKERELSEKERAEAVEHALNLLQQEQVWIKYHDQLTDEVRELYRQRGIPDFWIDYLRLGYNPAKYYKSAGENHIGPALTIPCFEPGTWKVLNVKSRLLSPADPGDKYRPEIAGLPACLYAPEPDQPLKGRALVVEGEFKSIVTMTTLDDVNTVVVGLPSKMPDTSLLAKFDNCDPVVLLLDPDAYVVQAGKGGKSAVERLCGTLGKRARVARLTGKVDDLIVQGHLDKHSLKAVVDGARIY